MLLGPLLEVAAELIFLACLGSLWDSYDSLICSTKGEVVPASTCANFLSTLWSWSKLSKYTRKRFRNVLKLRSRRSSCTPIPKESMLPIARLITSRWMCCAIPTLFQYPIGRTCPARYHRSSAALVGIRLLGKRPKPMYFSQAGGTLNKQKKHRRSSENVTRHSSSWMCKAPIPVIFGSVPTSPRSGRLLEFQGLRFIIDLPTVMPSFTSSLSTANKPFNSGREPTWWSALSGTALHSPLAIRLLASSSHPPSSTITEGVFPMVCSSIANMVSSMWVMKWSTPWLQKSLISSIPTSGGREGSMLFQLIFRAKRTSSPE